MSSRRRSGWANEPGSRRFATIAAAGVVLANVFLGRWPPLSPTDFVLAATMLAAAVVHPPLGLVTLIAASLVSPLAIETGSATHLLLCVLLVPALMVLWSVRTWIDRDARVFSLRPTRALASFLLITFLAFVAANLPWIGAAKVASPEAQLGQLAIFFFSAGTFVLAADWILDLETLALLTWSFLALGGLMVLGRGAPELGFVNVLFQDPAAGSLFWTWLTALAFGQAAFNGDLGWRTRSLLSFLVFTAFYVGIGYHLDWLSGWVPPSVAVFVALCMRHPRIGLFLILAGSGIFAFYLPEAFQGVTAGGNLYSWETRIDAWRIMLDIIATSPIFGLGPANYYHVTPDFPIRGYAVHFSSHNQYVDIAAQTGVLGLICFFWFVWEIGRVAVQLRGRVRSGFAAGYLYGAVGGFAGTLVAGMLGDWLLPFVYNVTLAGFRASVLGWIFLGGLLALRRIVESRT